MESARIFYFCYDHQTPTGGQKHTYQHVDVLRRRGYDAYVVHQRPGFRLVWFDNETRVVDHSRFVRLFEPERDFVVLPEDWKGFASDLPGRKIIFNKNIFRGFQQLGLTSPSPDPYANPNIVAAFVVSEHNAIQLRYAYPSLDVYEVTLDLREDMFRSRPLAAKRRQIAAIPKTRSLSTVYQMFMARARAGLVPGGPCEWIFLQERTETEVAAVLTESLLFVFLSGEEGLGRMPLEALLSGCVVVTYGNGPLRGLMPTEFCCDYAEPASTVRTIEAVLEAWPDRLEPIQARIATAREAACRYSGRAQEETVCAAWDSILRKARDPARCKTLM